MSKIKHTFQNNNPEETLSLKQNLIQEISLTAHIIYDIIYSRTFICFRELLFVLNLIHLFIFERSSY